ncbi:hypothetical protein P879_03964 [Paragonimus westermani]|uniref:Uncharacterized protein n=1 Tax=Paragonimus westermani TaxID=34504 RepID=A0A8T0D9T7_9TREM|nr:hypothetical protein P879_03964 [Paragonimus westermani]
MIPNDVPCCKTSSLPVSDLTARDRRSYNELTSALAIEVKNDVSVGRIKFYPICSRDHDEETSVIDAVCSLNEVRGVKQLGRYFKQVSQSARKGQSGDLDDFLGCITIDLRDIPFEETHYWLKLKGRTVKSKVQGEIHIGLSLSAREQGDEQTRLTELKEHIQITYFFISQELKHLRVSNIYPQIYSLICF